MEKVYYSLYCLTILFKVTDNKNPSIKDDFIQDFDMAQSEESLDSLSSFFTTSSTSLDIFSNDEIKDKDNALDDNIVNTSRKDSLEVNEGWSEDKKPFDTDQNTQMRTSTSSPIEYAICYESTSKTPRTFSPTTNDMIIISDNEKVNRVSRIKTIDYQRNKNSIMSSIKGINTSTVQPLTPPSSPGKPTEPLRVSISVSTIPTTAPPSTCFIPILTNPNINMLNQPETSTSNKSNINPRSRSFQGKYYIF